MNEEKSEIIIGGKTLTELSKALDRPAFVPDQPLLSEAYIATAKDLFIYALQWSSISKLCEGVKDKYPKVLSELQSISEVVYDAVLLMHERRGEIVSVRIDENTVYDLPNSEVLSAKLDEVFFLYDITSLMASTKNNADNSLSLGELMTSCRIYTRMIQVGVEFFQLVAKNTYQIHSKQE